jgi:hypothetical protein
MAFRWVAETLTATSAVIVLWAGMARIFGG